MDKKLQLRNQRFTDAKFRAEEEGGKRYIRGYPVVFNVPGHPYRGSDWTEVIDPGALADADLSGLRLLFGHDTRQVLAKAGVNLRAEVDAVGLFIEAELPDTTLARDAWELVQRQILDGMSFSFWADRWETDAEKKQERVTHITDLPEVSIVTFPAYAATVVMATERQQHDPAMARALAEAELNFYLSTF